MRRTGSRSAKLRAECGFPHFTARFRIKPRRRNRALALQNAASHAGFLKLLTRDILSLSSLHRPVDTIKFQKHRLSEVYFKDTVLFSHLETMA